MEENNKPHIARRIIGDFLLLAVTVVTVNVAVIMLRKIGSVVLKVIYIRVFRAEMILCAILLVAALDLRFNLFTRIRAKAAKVIGWILRILVCCVTAVILFFCGKVLAGSVIRSSVPSDAVIVLGMALEDGKPMPDLISRLDTAEKYLADHPDAVLYLTGGNPDESGKTEAAAMREILLERGITDEHMVLEDQAKSTEANFKNTAELVDPASPIVLISSNYHMDRAVKSAKSAGFTQILRCPAPSEVKSFCSNIMWEVVMEMQEYTKRSKSRK